MRRRPKMNGRRRILVVNLAVLALVLGALPSGTQRVSADYDEWEIACSENPSEDDNYLFGVAAQADDAVVAVGSMEVSGVFTPLIELWADVGGTTCFTEQDSPNPTPSGHSELNGIARVPTSSISQKPFWAVGYQGAGTRSWDSDIGDWTIGSDAQTLIEYSSDGGQSWSIVSSPNVEDASNVLKGVAARATNDAWAVGYYDEGNGERTLILHWNGTSWSQVSSPNQQGAIQNWLYGVSIVSEDDVWAVGFARYSPPVWPRVKNLILRWNGTNWTEQSSTPQPSSYFNYLFGGTGITSSKANAVGAYFPDDVAKDTQALTWNGTAWSSPENSPSPGDGANVFYGVAPVTSDYIWAVGSAEDPPHRTLTARRVSGTWYHITSPNANSYSNELRGVAVVPGTSPCAGGNNWAVGYYMDGSSVAHTLAMRYQISAGCDLNP
jgi:hypothetical protein